MATIKFTFVTVDEDQKIYLIFGVILPYLCSKWLALVPCYFYIVNSYLRLLKILLSNLIVSWPISAAIVRLVITEYTQSIGAH